MVCEKKNMKTNWIKDFYLSDKYFLYAVDD